MLDGFVSDVRHGIRSLQRHRLVAVLIVTTLSLGIGVVTALFAVIAAVLLRPIVPDQDRVVRVSKLDTARGNFPASLSLPEFELWQQQTRSFDVLAAVDHAATGDIALAIDGRTSPVRMAPVAGDFFGVIQRGQPLYGRWLQPSDEFVGAAPVAVVSERFWQRASGRDPAFVGRRLTWGGNRTLVVVGIAPSDVDYPLGTDIWIPGTAVFDGQAGRFDARNPGFAQFELLGRLAPRISAEQARAELAVIQDRIVRQFPADYMSLQVLVRPILDVVVGSTRQIILVLFAAASLVFVIAGINVAALLLMRASSRLPEMHVRTALGAGVWQLLRHTIAEALVLGVSGTIGGLLIARGCVALILWLAPADVPRIEQAAIDFRVLAFCAIAASAWVFTLGVVPMWAYRRGVLSPGLTRSIREGSHRTTALRVFTVAQISAAVIVAIGAGLLVRSLDHLRTIDRGFDSHNLLMMSLLLPDTLQRDPKAMLAFYDRLLPQIEALPGVVSASPTHVGPGSGTLGLSAPMRFDNQTVDAAKTNPWSTWEPVLPSYFRTLGIRIVSGREFTDADRADGVPVTIVSESLARRYWPGQSAIGKRLQFVATPEWPWVTVVGVATDTRYRDLTNPWMTAYFPARQFFFFQAASLLVRTSMPPEAVVPAVLQRIHAVEPAATVTSTSTMTTLLARELARPLIAVTVSLLFALLASLLAAVGVYGVMAYEVRERRREIAVRLTVGAAPADIFRTIARRSVIVGGSGVIIGLAIAATGTQAIRSLLYGVAPVDPLTFLVGAVVLFGIALTASYFPARQAAATDPAVALRAE
jgi:predicted permease